MISHISIKDFAIIEDVCIDFHEGLNIITGETGAGKSIIIQAVSLALGARADTAFVRSGKDKAVVSLMADYNGEEYAIVREVSASGRNLCKINGEPATVAQVSKLCTKIADIHGQYDHQSLLNTDNHIGFVDIYGKKEIEPLKAQVSLIYSQYQNVSRELASLLSGFEERRRKKDFMAFELDELENASLKPGEDDELEERIAFLSNGEKILSALSEAYQLISEEKDISRVLSLVSEISFADSSLKALEERIAEIYYSLEDITAEIRKKKDQADFSPEELDCAVLRLDEINRLKRKHSKSIDELIAYKSYLADEISKADNIDELKEKLSSEKNRLYDDLMSLCSELTSQRKKCALELEDKILNELKDLNFKDAALEISFTPLDAPGSDGIDSVEFLISTNRGEQLKPLAKVASGGEMSRIMLAFKKITADYDHIPSMIFDEIDSGISGITASIVGKKMRQIAQNHQIICITHLPQIAACGDHNYRIMKDVSDDKTFTDVTPLDRQETVKEIARLIGGINITDTTIKSAEELISSCK